MKAGSSMVLRLAACGLFGAATAQAADPPGAPVAVSSNGASAQVTTVADSPVADSGREAALGAAPAAVNAQQAGAATKAEPQAAANAGPAGAAARATADEASARERSKHKEDVRDPLGASVIDEAQLAKARGGASLGPEVSTATLQGSTTGNMAANLTTGSNSISEDTFSNSSGIPVVIQNTGNNVLIQNSTILNLQLSTPNK